MQYWSALEASQLSMARSCIEAHVTLHGDRVIAQALLKHCEGKVTPIVVTMKLLHVCQDAGKLWNLFKKHGGVSKELDTLNHMDESQQTEALQAVWNAIDV